MPSKTRATQQPNRAVVLLVVLGVFFAATHAKAAELSPHSDPIGALVLELAALLIAAKVGGEVAVRLRLPAVLGELFSGVVLGNLAYVGVPTFGSIATNPYVDVLGRLGILILLFDVGLESTVRQMLSVGLSSLLVAVVGVTVPVILGWGVGAWLLPDAGPYAHAFLGAALAATSVGITARVLQDLHRAQTIEARIILGAAVIDDVLGLVVLAVVGGAIASHEAGRPVQLSALARVIGTSLAFLVGALGLGVWLAPRLFRQASRLRTQGVLLAVGLALCFGLAWLSGAFGLAPIIGAFAAGLILEPVHYEPFVQRGEHPLDTLIHPISNFLAPVFFVLMGMRTDLRAFGAPHAVLLAVALTVVAILGKLASAVGARGRGLDRLSIGIGMVPRGEVGLIFANLGLTLQVDGRPLLNETTFSALVLVIIVTTMVTPLALQWSLARPRPGHEHR